MTINTPNRALIEDVDGLRRLSAGIKSALGIGSTTPSHGASIHIGHADYERLERVIALLDAARAEGPVQERPKRGEIRIIGGKRSRFIEADDRGDVWEILDVVTPPADEVGRAVERLNRTLAVWATEVVVADGAVVQLADLRLILSHVSRLEGELEEVRSARDEAIKMMTEYARQAGDAKGRLEMSEAVGIVDGWREKYEGLERSLKLAVEVLERVTDHLDVWACDHAQDRTAETDASIFCAREALRSIRSPIRGSDISPLRHEDMPLAPGGDA